MLLLLGSGCVALAVGASMLIGRSDVSGVTGEKALLLGSLDGEMLWDEVAAVRQPNSVFRFVTASATGLMDETRFDDQALAEALRQGMYPEGFAFSYQFDGRCQVLVHFDERGRLMGTERVGRETTVVDQSIRG